MRQLLNDRFRLIFLSLLVAGLLMSAFAVLVAAQGPYTIDATPSLAEVAPDEMVVFQLTYGLPDGTSPSPPGIITATWSANATFVRASEGGDQIESSRVIRWIYEDGLPSSDKLPDFTIKVGEGLDRVVVSATLTVSSTDDIQTRVGVTNTTVSVFVASREAEPEVEELAAADLTRSSLAISPTGTTAAGSPIIITLVVSNTGEAPAEDVFIALSQTLRLTNLAIAQESLSVATQTSVEGDDFVFKLNQPVPPQSEAKVLLTASVPPDATGELRITGSISATGTISTPLSTAAVTILPARPRLIVEIDQSDSAREGEPLSMVLKVSNVGAAAVESAEIVVQTSPSVELAASGTGVAAAFPNGNRLVITLARLDPGATADITLTGTAPSAQIPLIVDVSVPDPESYDPASVIRTSQTIAVQPAPTSPPPPTATPVEVAPTEPVAELIPTPVPPVEPIEGTDTLLVIGVVALLVALGSAMALLFLLRRNRKQKPAPVPSVAPSSATQPATVPVLPSSPAPGAFMDSLSPSVRWPLGDGVTTIGRDPASAICIDETYMNWETVSRKHAEIRREGDYYVIYDVSNRNGVYVQGQRTARNLLRSGARIGIGGVEFIFRDAATAGQ